MSTDRFDQLHDEYLDAWVEDNLRHLYEACADFIPWTDAQPSSEEESVTTDPTTRIPELAAQIEERLTEDETTANAAHIARNDPARVLRRVTATRELVAAILALPHVPDSEWYGRECTCGRDEDVARLLGIIASEWEEA